jgi:ribosomal-protein-serine acetyltransferase
LASITIDDDLLLRNYTPEDAPGLFAAIDASRKHLHPWLSWVDKTTKEEHSLQYIQDSLYGPFTKEALVLGIFYRDTIIGGIGMHNWDHNTKRAQIGYWIGKGHEGKGIINKCLTAFVPYLFDKIGLNKIEIHFMPANKRSAKVAERLGFKTEGIIRQSIIHNGMPQDVVIAGLLKSEWPVL